MEVLALTKYRFLCRFDMDTSETVFLSGNLRL